MNIFDVNRTLRTAFAGDVAGVVFEGEKRFDMVVRLDKALRTDIDDIRNCLIPIPDGAQIPLSQLAQIDFNAGPDRRFPATTVLFCWRMTLGLNVRTAMCNRWSRKSK